MKFRLLLALSALTAAPVAEARAPTMFGFMAQHSEPQSAFGRDQSVAFTMMLPFEGRKLGGFAVEDLVADSQLKPEGAAQIVDRLIERDKVPIITGLTFSKEFT